MVNDEDIMVLANLIVEFIKEDFETKHLSGNLANTIQIQKTENGFSVVVPAEKYNIPMYIRKGVVIHSGTGSYASRLDEEGSMIRLPRSGPGRPKNVKIGNHIGYVENAIRKAIERWRTMMQDKYQIDNVQE